MEQHGRLCDVLQGGKKQAAPRSALTGLRGQPFEPLADGDVYQFGVGRGVSMAILLREYRRRTWGFDTFVGMPSPEQGEWTMSAWRKAKGNFALTTDVNRSMAEMKPKVCGQLEPCDVRFVPGPFDSSLTETLATSRGMRPATYVDIDSDHYSAARTALDWLFSQRLIWVGTVVGYDDWWDLPCTVTLNNKRPSLDSPFTSGEAKAHQEVTRRWGVRFRCICGPCMPYESQATLRHTSFWRVYFVVEAIGSDAPDPGYALTPADTDFLAQQFDVSLLWVDVPRCAQTLSRLRSRGSCQRAARRAGLW